VVFAMFIKEYFVTRFFGFSKDMKYGREGVEKRKSKTINFNLIVLFLRIKIQ